jgi:D-cysteine desulfhydrase
MKTPRRYPLANLPTPIQRCRDLGRSYGVEIFIKRDDRTGLVTSGNKIRKLEFLIHEALAQGCDTLITWGAIQSNHARATAAVAAHLGLHCLILLRGEKTEVYQGNLLLDRLMGADVIFLTSEEYQQIDAVALHFAERLRRQGRKPYLIPEGGSNPLGSWGYIRMVKELVGQMKQENLTFDSLICAVGSGGTYGGLLLGKKLWGLKTRLYGINVCRDASYFTDKIGAILDQAIEIYRLPLKIRPEEIRIIDGYVGRGYALTQERELQTLIRIAQGEGIVLDPVYTNKAMHGLLDQLEKDPKRFGEKILFLHTGGLFGLFPVAEEISQAMKHP